MRQNIFHSTHLPLKTALLTSCVSLSKAINDGGSVSDAMQKIASMLQIFNEQLTLESLYILPNIFTYEPSVWNNYNSDHYNLHRQGLELRKLVEQCAGLQGYEQSLMLQLCSEQLNTFTMLNYDHMDEEEAVLNEILWRYYPDGFLKDIQCKMIMLLEPVEHESQLQIAA